MAVNGHLLDLLSYMKRGTTSNVPISVVTVKGCGEAGVSGLLTCKTPSRAYLTRCGGTVGVVLPVPGHGRQERVQYPSGGPRAPEAGTGRFGQPCRDRRRLGRGAPRDRRGAGGRRLRLGRAHLVQPCAGRIGFSPRGQLCNNVKRVSTYRLVPGGLQGADPVAVRTFVK